MKKRSRTRQAVAPELGQNFVNFIFRRPVGRQHSAQEGCQAFLQLADGFIVPFEALLHCIDICKDWRLFTPHISSSNGMLPSKHKAKTRKFCRNSEMTISLQSWRVEA